MLDFLFKLVGSYKSHLLLKHTRSYEVRRSIKRRVVFNFFFLSPFVLLWGSIVCGFVWCAIRIVYINFFLKLFGI